MGWLTVLLSAAGTFFFFKSGYTILGVITVIIMIGCFWSYGVMHNYATEMAKRRANYTGSFYDITSKEAEAIPDWIALINMAFSLLGIILFVATVVIIFII